MSDCEGCKDMGCTPTAGHLEDARMTTIHANRHVRNDYLLETTWDRAVKIEPEDEVTNEDGAANGGNTGEDGGAAGNDLNAEDGAAGDHGPEDGAASDHGPEDGAASDHGPEDGVAGDNGAKDGEANGDFGADDAVANGDHIAEDGMADGDFSANDGKANGDFGAEDGAAGDHGAEDGEANGDFGAEDGEANGYNSAEDETIIIDDEDDDEEGMETDDDSIEFVDLSDSEDEQVLSPQEAERRAHARQLSDTYAAGSKVVRCNLCRKWCGSDPTSAIQHVEVHINQLLYQCGMCGKKKTTNLGMEMHMNSRHRHKEYRAENIHNRSDEFHNDIMVMLTACYQKDG